MNFKINLIIVSAFLICGCSTLKNGANFRSPSNVSEDIEKACEAAAKSRIRYYDAQYIKSDCLLFISQSPKITADHVVACAATTNFASSFFDCLSAVKEQKTVVTSEHILACGGLTKFYDFGIRDYCIDVITERLSPEKIESCKKVGKDDVRTCLVRSANQ